MTDKIAVALGLVILVALGIDWQVYNWDGTLFLARKLIMLIEWLAFWR